MKLLHLTSGLLLGALAACASTPPLASSANVTVVAADALPAPTRADQTVAQRPYLIGPFDKLAINVFGIPDLSGEVQADASGRVSVPLIGSVDAAGQTPAELAATIARGLRGRYVRDPQVTVNLKDTVSQVITVDGEVHEPGLYPVVGHMSLMRAIATAKGVSEYAKLDDVVIFRTVENRHLVALYSLKAIRRGNYEDPEVFAGDVVVVGDSPGRRLFKDIISGSALLTAPIILLQRL
ncbi:Soluble ligand binding domain-containing protein [Sphingomonas antarctica]|uniref:polysaccharide biosynthesis/export family protein n=1 Tax=Sphingomonas antarctica TaxID=2040274 RepID=UPI0039EB7823